MHARVGWLLLHRLAKQLGVDDCVPPVQNDQGVSSIEVLAGAASRHTTLTIETGGMKMRNRTAWFIVGVVLVCVLALMGTGFVMAATHGAFGAGSTAQASVAQNKPVVGATDVYMRHETFTPAHIQVVLGTTVTWTNQDNVPHNVTISPDVITTSPNWESALLYPGQSFSYTFTSRGTFQYHCQEHPSSMIGTVSVT